MPKTALAMMRTQPLHKGHCWIINEMLQEADTVIIGLGSCDKTGTRSNPLSPDLRSQQIKNVYGTRVRTIHFRDLGATPDKSDWIDHVLKKISDLGLPDPTDYYTGSPADAIWYDRRFYHPEISSGSVYEEDYETPTGQRRVMHLMDRASQIYPITATELRSFIELQSDQWKPWVPSVNHQLVIDNYPPEFLVG